MPAGSQATASITGDYPDQKLNLSLPAGEDGEPGPANELTIGIVETLPPGENATATITGDAPNQTLNLSIPRGDPGQSTVITQVLSGEELNPLTAGVGTYYLQPGAFLRNGPSSGVTSMFNALITVRIKGISINLIAFCHFSVTSGYLHCGEWVLMDNGTGLFLVVTWTW